MGNVSQKIHKHSDMKKREQSHTRNAPTSAQMHSGGGQNQSPEVQNRPRDPKAVGGARGRGENA